MIAPYQSAAARIAASSSPPEADSAPAASPTVTSSGLRYTDEAVGTGATAKAGQTVQVHYTGWLYKDGQQSAKFVARRNSSGGMGAGFKGSCDVLERSVNAIGKDVAAWLQNPVDGAQLGDLR